MREHALLAEFKGHKIGNKYKTIIRFYNDRMQPWKVIAYDEVYKTVYSIPKTELFAYVFTVLFKGRRLFTSGEEMSALLDGVLVEDNTEMYVPEKMDRVAYLKSEYGTEYVKGTLNLNDVVWFSDLSTYDLFEPRPCVPLGVDKLLISFPEFHGIILANPKYFEVKEKIR